MAWTVEISGGVYVLLQEKDWNFLCKKLVDLEIRIRQLEEKSNGRD